MNVRNLKTFIAVADQGNFARAANAVGLTQSAVSMQMRSLENLLGIQLFDRTKRPAVLSEQGEVLVKRAREIVKLFEALVGDAADSELQPSALHLGAVRSTLSGLLPRALTAFNHQFPGVRIDVISGLPSDLIARLERGDLDGVIVGEPQYRAPQLTWVPLMEEPLTVIAAVETGGETFDDLLTCNPYIKLSRGAWGGQLIDDFLQSRGIVLRPFMEFDCIEPVMLTVQRGIGVSIVHQGCLDHPFRSMLRRISLGDPPLVRRIGLLYRPTGQTAGVIDALLLELKRAGAEQRDIWWPLREEKPVVSAKRPIAIRRRPSRSALR